MAEFPIVGIGSSAGGLEALQTLFRGMPADSGLAFIIAAHLDPTQKSHLTELLSRCTKMLVVQIEKSLEVKPNHVYVIAPDQELTIRKGVIHTDKPTAPRGHRHPVDSFFRSLAEDQGERAIAIILSGTGTNGSLGLRFIKAEGGIAIAQDPDSAGFSGMPRSAIATGIVDLVLRPDQMPEVLCNLAHHPYVRQPAETLVDGTPEDQLHVLLSLVRSSTRRDFSTYRKRTLLRRIHRRMGLHRLEGLPSYIERLRDDPGEVKALAADLTINVTGFFRDPEAWQILANKVVAPLVRERPAESTIRIWVPGCSTGEEAYSIAILILEQAEAARKSFDLKLFATDVAEGVVSSARAGTYPASIAQDVSPKRLERWFRMEEDTYSIGKTLRDTITFAPQNLLQDPPFSRMDLISCRNLLIYLEPDFQKQVLALFHFALREGGNLFLGPAESIAGREDLFAAVSKKWRIYRRLGSTRHDIVDFPLIGPRELPADADVEEESARPRVRPSTAGELMDRALLERYAPASVLIDRQCRVYYLRGPTEEYLRPPTGEPSYNLINMARDGLQSALRSAVRQAIEGGEEVSESGRVRRGGHWHPVQIVVVPLRFAGDAPVRLLVSFSERVLEAEPSARAKLEEAAPDIELQAELDAAREDLRLSVEQMEAANEELKASNEEIRSINEELQASNEELETSKEELQSLNEELTTVNNQLQAKVGELEARTDDLNNLLNSTDVATLFLDRTLRIRWFTPTMKTLLELLPTDIGRPISHFAQRFSGGDLLEDARKVLERLAPSAAEIVDDLGRWYIRRITPYRTANDRIDGVVVTFTEITERKHHEQQVEAAREYAEHVIEAVRFPLVVLTPEQRVRSVNEAFCQLFGVSREETEGKLFSQLGNRQWDIPELHRLLARVLSERREFVDFEIEHDFERMGRRTMILHARPLDGEQLVLVGMVDLTDRKAEERRREDLLAQLGDERARFEAVLHHMPAGVILAEAPSGRLLLVNEQAATIWGRPLDEGGAMADYQHFRGSHADGSPLRTEEWPLARSIATGEVVIDEEIPIVRADNTAAVVSVSSAPIYDADGAIAAGVAMFVDITGRKENERERELLAQELSHRVKNTLAVVQSLALQTDGRARSVEAYRQAFVGRLQALARAQNLLHEAHWRGTNLRALVEQTVAVYRMDHPQVVEVEGEPIAVTPRQGLGLSLILHELGTNAAKHGALTRSEGRLHISWQVEQASDRRVRLRWQERHGPAIAPPTTKGFGTRLIERACEYELEGEVELEYAPSGLSCELVFPVGS
jgi:two-component system, chemotaxis family, CheB/CheR fusion protein